MLLKLDFRDEFKLEKSDDCRYDFFEVRDGQHGYSNLLGNFCGTNFPPEITSKTRYLWLRFHSDESIEGKGFKAVWNMVPRPTYRKSTKLQYFFLSLALPACAIRDLTRNTLHRLFYLKICSVELVRDTTRNNRQSLILY